LGGDKDEVAVQQYSEHGICRWWKKRISDIKKKRNTSHMFIVFVEIIKNTKKT